MVDSDASGQMWRAVVQNDRHTFVEAPSYDRLVGRAQGTTQMLMESRTLREAALRALMNQAHMKPDEFAGRKVRWEVDGKVHVLEMIATPKGRKLALRIGIDCPVCGKRRMVNVAQRLSVADQFLEVWDGGGERCLGDWLVMDRTCKKCREVADAERARVEQAQRR